MSRSSTSSNNLNGEDLQRVVKDGSYFEQARAWYRTEFVLPISQRNWMMLIAAASVFCGLCGVFSFLGLLPINERPTIPASQERIEDYVIYGTRMRESGQTVDEGVLRFFVTEYIERREAYSEKRYEDFYNFVKAHSDEAVFAEYDGIFGTTNPRSLRNVLGAKGRRSITIENQRVSVSGSKIVANATFSASFSAENLDIPRSQWKVIMEATYRPIMAREIDVAGLDVALDIKPPSFKVTRYALEQIK